QGGTSGSPCTGRRPSPSAGDRQGPSTRLPRRTVAPLRRTPQGRTMGKRNWSIAMEPHPTQDGHERLVRALRFVAKSAPCLTRTPTDMKRALGLDDPADD